MIEIRKAVPSDAEALATIEQKCISHPWSLVLFNADLRNPNAIYFVAEDNGNIVGFLGAHDIVGEVNITNVAVLTIYRCSGIGTQLMQALIDYCNKKIEQGQELIGITLEVRKSNTPAIKLYEKHGFVTEGVRKYYYSDGEDAMIMWKRYGKSSS